MEAQKIFNLAGTVFDWNNRTISIGGKQIHKLTVREADILLMLCENPNEIVERSVFLNKLWGQDDFFNARSMDVFITKLRKYLSGNPALSIVNVRGKGFILNVK